MKKTVSLAVLLAAAVAGGATTPHIFGNDMVLQRDSRLPVWGKGAPGERVTVSFAGQERSAVAGEDGKWKLWLDPVPASAEGRDFRVTGAGGDVVFTNVVVGEVWFCSGQSNMEFTMSSNRKVKNWQQEVAAANWPDIRHFNAPHNVAKEPQDDVRAAWVPTTPKTIPPQSAVAFFFGETLYKALGVPVGLINCSWGGTGIEPWTPVAHPDDLWLVQNLGKWGRPHDVPTVLWNGMVSGLVPFAIKGAIWYQGCHNVGDGKVYLDKTVALVRGWRREWGQGDFPYFLVQLAPYSYGNPDNTNLPVFQETQARVEEAVPNSGYTVINDVGDVNDIHPTDKRTVGMRLADQVLDRVYGKFVRPWKTPVAKSVGAEGSALRVSFENADGLKTRDGLAPTCFELRDLSGMWVPATAEIRGTEVVVSSEDVKTPLGVRFAGHNGSTPNLVNGNGLPAGPFRFSCPCPIGAAETLAAGDGYVCVQRYDIPVNCDFLKTAPETLASVDGVARVGYLLELQNGQGDTSFVFAEMDSFAQSSDALVLRGGRMPDVRTAVSGLRVRSSVDGVPCADGTGSGFVEFYGGNYGMGTLPTPAFGDAKKFDCNDTPSGTSGDKPGYGCLQIHDARAKTTVLAFNHFNNSAVPCDVGIGKGTGEHPDWTFARNAGEYRARRLSVWVKTAR